MIDPIPLEQVIDAATAAARQNPLPAAVTDVRAIVLVRELGVEVVLARVDQLEAIKIQLMPVFASHLAEIGPLFLALDRLAEAAGAGVPALLISHAVDGNGFEMRQTFLPLQVPESN